MSAPVFPEAQSAKTLGSLLTETKVSQQQGSGQCSPHDLSLLPGMGLEPSEPERGL